jgi:hypothetical protein
MGGRFSFIWPMIIHIVTTKSSDLFHYLFFIFNY